VLCKIVGTPGKVFCETTVQVSYLMPFFYSDVNWALSTDVYITGTTNWYVFGNQCTCNSSNFLKIAFHYVSN
jgi:hypothetical protein